MCIFILQVAPLPLESPDVKEVLVDSWLRPNEKFCVLTVDLWYECASFCQPATPSGWHFWPIFLPFGLTFWRWKRPYVAMRRSSESLVMAKFKAGVEWFLSWELTRLSLENFSWQYEDGKMPFERLLFTKISWDATRLKKSLENGLKWEKDNHLHLFVSGCFRLRCCQKNWLFPRAREIRESVCAALVKKVFLMDFSHLCQNILRDTDRWKFEFI